LPIARLRHQNETGAYRPDIDGLRAVSILLVVGYHAQPSLVPGGFIGVDIFFVISGFLITRIILSQVKTNTFSFMEFYARRIRRIFPALIVVLAVTYLIGWFVLLPTVFRCLGRALPPASHLYPICFNSDRPAILRRTRPKILSCTFGR
jgi:peptidoglycan/LPS O-acetylase OafA/YrhL